MTTADFIDVGLTPIGGGIGAAIGYWFLLRRSPDAALTAVPRWAAIAFVGVLVALALFTFKTLF